jgi:hypothetical protein
MTRLLHAHVWGILAVATALGLGGVRIQGAQPGQASGSEGGGAIDDTNYFRDVLTQADRDLRALTVRVSTAESSHWLGVLAAPVDDALKSQLNLEERLILEQVLPDSPAEKAGLKTHDILLKLADTEIHTLEDLIETIGKHKDKEVSLSLLRGGKKQTVTVKPEKRPDSAALEAVESGEMEDVVSSWLRERGGVWRPDGSMRLRFFGPGILSPDADLPEELAVTIKKQGNEPAEIVVKRNDEKWEITEENVEDLPDDIRPHVARLLGRGRVQGLRLGPRGGPLQFRPEFDLDALRERQEQRIRLPERTMSLEELRQQFEQLRKEVDTLKEERLEETEDGEERGS